MTRLVSRNNGERKSTFSDLGPLWDDHRAVDPVLTIEVKGSATSLINLPKFRAHVDKGANYDYGKKLVIKLHTAHDPTARVTNERLISIMIFSKKISRSLTAHQKTISSNRSKVWTPQYTDEPTPMSRNEAANINNVLGELGPKIFEGFSRQDQEFIQKMLSQHLLLNIPLPNTDFPVFDVFANAATILGR